MGRFAPKTHTRSYSHWVAQGGGHRAPTTKILRWTQKKLRWVNPAVPPKRAFLLEFELGNPKGELQETTTRISRAGPKKLGGHPARPSLQQKHTFLLGLGCQKRTPQGPHKNIRGGPKKPGGLTSRDPPKTHILTRIGGPKGPPPRTTARIFGIV